MGGCGSLKSELNKVISVERGEGVIAPLLVCLYSKSCIFGAGLNLYSQVIWSQNRGKVIKKTLLTMRLQERSEGG